MAEQGVLKACDSPLTLRHGRRCCPFLQGQGVRGLARFPRKAEAEGVGGRRVVRG